MEEGVVRVDIAEATTVMRRRAEASGLAVAAAAVPYTFQRTLMSRSTLDQAIVTGLSFSLYQATISAVQGSIQAASLVASRAEVDGHAVDLGRWSRASIVADLAVAVGGAGLHEVLRRQSGESVGRAAARTGAFMASVTGVAGVIAGTAQESSRFQSGWRARVGFGAVSGAIAAQREWDRRRRETLLEAQGIEPSEIAAARSLAMGVGVAVGASMLGRLESSVAGRVSETASRVFPGGQALWAPIGHVAALGVVSGGARIAAQRIFRMIEGQQYAVEPAVDVAPLYGTVSGGPGSLIDFRSMGKMGRRFVWTVRSADIIQQVTGEAAVAEPIRVYVGLENAADDGDRVELAMSELRRTGAFDRRWLMITTPTGTGYGNYAAAGALELLSLGDCANVVMQYAARPSPISIDRVADGRTQVRRLVDAIARELASRSANQRPRVVMFGESLGAWSSQDAFISMGAQGLIDAGIDHAIWIGTPMESKWKNQVLGPDRSPLDAAVIGVFNDIEEWWSLPEEERSRLRYVMVTHHNDGVAVFGPSLAVQEPEWLAPGAERPPSVPASQRWIPITSFIQGLIDNKNAARVVPGVFGADGHDYRADIVPFFDAVLGFEATEDRKELIVRALETEEWRRTRWISARGVVGSSMAATVLEKVRAQDPEAFETATRAVMREFVESNSSPHLD
jgi:uncharacterized membrane protein